MRFWDFNRHITSANILLGFGGRLGLPAPDLLANTGLAEQNLALIDNPHTEISAAQELQIITNLMDLARPGQPLGLMCGQAYTLSSFGIWGEGIRSCATLRDAAHMALRLVRLTYAFSLMSLHETADHAVLTFGEPNLQAGLNRFLIERDMSAAAGLVAELADQRAVVKHVSFRFRSQGLDTSQFFDGKLPEYGARVNALAYDRKVFDMPLKHANPAKAAELEAMCNAMLDQRKRRISVAQQVQQYLRVPGVDIPDQPTMARLMYMSERTLKRKLAEEGHSYRDISANVRKKLAEDGLKNPKVSISALASRLGYADVSSFSQAFKRWFGVSPLSFRNGVGKGLAEHVDSAEQTANSNNA